MSQLTTHILDTSKGLPAAGITVLLYSGLDATEIAKGITNMDGRITGLLGKNRVLEPGTYKLRFETKAYFDKHQVATFYPFIEISFEIKDSEHYHVPLLLNPFGYSTYRGT